MVIDAAKGIEAQTKKLFEVCRKRAIPIFTFINKLDRPTLEPLALIDEIENVLGLGAFPMNYPLGTGLDFKGIYDRISKEIHLFEKTTGGQFIARYPFMTYQILIVKDKLSENNYNKLIEEIEMLDTAGEQFDSAAVLEGGVTPVFFGSAMNNFGVQLLLDGFLSYAVRPLQDTV